VNSAGFWWHIACSIYLQVYWWHDKYRPRKPKYFNRVHTGYEWNKYNQTHYDHDNPPPKIVQGYKFNIFYPDLVDKSKAPTYSIEKDGSAGETCFIRFHAGPPYEDIVSVCALQCFVLFFCGLIHGRYFHFVLFHRLSVLWTRSGNTHTRRGSSVLLSVGFSISISTSSVTVTGAEMAQEAGENWIDWTGASWFCCMLWHGHQSSMYLQYN
jgi:hypothetical protein